MGGCGDRRESGQLASELMALRGETLKQRNLEVQIDAWTICFLSS